MVHLEHASVTASAMMGSRGLEGPASFTELGIGRVCRGILIIEVDGELVGAELDEGRVSFEGVDCSAD